MITEIPQLKLLSFEKKQELLKKITDVMLRGNFHALLIKLNIKNRTKIYKIFSYFYKWNEQMNAINDEEFNKISEEKEKEKNNSIIEILQQSDIFDWVYDCLYDKPKTLMYIFQEIGLINITINIKLE